MQRTYQHFHPGEVEVQAQRGTNTDEYEAVSHPMMRPRSTRRRRSSSVATFSFAGSVDAMGRLWASPLFSVGAPIFEIRSPTDVSIRPAPSVGDLLLDNVRATGSSACRSSIRRLGDGPVDRSGHDRRSDPRLRDDPPRPVPEVHLHGRTSRSTPPPGLAVAGDRTYRRRPRPAPTHRHDVPRKLLALRHRRDPPRRCSASRSTIARSRSPTTSATACSTPRESASTIVSR